MVYIHKNCMTTIIFLKALNILNAPTQSYTFIPKLNKSKLYYNQPKKMTTKDEDEEKTKRVAKQPNRASNPNGIQCVSAKQKPVR